MSWTLFALFCSVVLVTIWPRHVRSHRLPPTSAPVDLRSLEFEDFDARLKLAEARQLERNGEEIRRQARQRVNRYAESGHYSLAEAWRQWAEEDDLATLRSKLEQ